jgi:hypothetical protein
LYAACGREGDDPVDEFPAAMPQLPQATDHLHPTKHLFHEFAFALAHGIARVPRGPAINRTEGLLLEAVAEANRLRTPNATAPHSTLSIE